MRSQVKFEPPVTARINQNVLSRWCRSLHKLWPFRQGELKWLGNVTDQKWSSTSNFLYTLSVPSSHNCYSFCSVNIFFLYLLWIWTSCQRKCWPPPCIEDSCVHTSVWWLPHKHHSKRRCFLKNKLLQLSKCHYPNMLTFTKLIWFSVSLQRPVSIGKTRTSFVSKFK